jgi:signal transduction histidine kinase
MPRLFAIVEDISTRKLAEIALRHSEKMAETGRLATSIAHEINNPLESITNLIYLAQRTDKPATVREYLKSAEKELQRVSVIANQTLRFYKQSIHPASVSSDELLDSVIAIHHGRLMQMHVTLEKRSRSTVPLLCFEGEIRQVLSNLIGNAIAAAAMRGRHIWARSREGVDWKTGRKGIVFTIADNGCGITAAHLGHIFEAFFTTKGSEGNGLGLWISHEIVARHHGVFHLRTRENRGSVFSFFLPFAAALRQ